jgi:hypothetical protein
MKPFEVYIDTGTLIGFPVSVDGKKPIGELSANANEE